MVPSVQLPPFAVQVVGVAQASGFRVVSQKPVQHAAPVVQDVPSTAHGLAHTFEALQKPEQHSAPVVQADVLPLHWTAHASGSRLVSQKPEQHSPPAVQAVASVLQGVPQMFDGSQ